MGKRISILLTVLIILSIVIFITACDTGGTDDVDDRNGNSAPSDDPDDDQDTGDFFDDDDVPSGECPNEYCVTEKENLGKEFTCNYSRDCIEDYENFIQIAQEYAYPITEDELQDQLDAIAHYEVELVEDTLPENELTDVIIEKTNIGFLLEDINKRPLKVTIIDKNSTNRYNYRELIFNDPYVGQFFGILLTPRQGGPHPAVVALHGHGDWAQIYMNDYFGEDYPGYGYAILMLSLRGMATGEWEDLITRKTLLNGFSMMGMRIYETLLALRYLYYLPNIDNDNIGLIGHSGGSTASNLTVRVVPELKAYVSDFKGKYYNYNQGEILDETLPTLYPYHSLILDFQTSTVPILDVPYGYQNERDEIFSFFNQNLK